MILIRFDGMLTSYAIESVSHKIHSFLQPITFETHTVPYGTAPVRQQYVQALCTKRWHVHAC